MTPDDKNKSEANERFPDRRSVLLGGAAIAAAASALTTGTASRAAEAQTPPAPSAKKPNILVIMGDDIGQSNISAYTFGLVGYRTPNIDRIAKALRHEVQRLGPLDGRRHVRLQDVIAGHPPRMLTAVADIGIPRHCAV